MATTTSTAPHALALAIEEEPIAQQQHTDSCGHSHGGGNHGHSHGHAPPSGSFHLQPRSGASSNFALGPPPGAPHMPPPPVRELTPLEELFVCAKRNNIERMRELLSTAQARSSEMVRARDPMGHTLAHWAAQKGGAELLEYLHSKDAAMDQPSEDSVKLHPIHWACSAGNLVALKTFVKLGVDVNCADAMKQRTPLLIAAQNGFPLLVMYLIRNGADVSLVDIDRDSAIHWAAYKGATEIVSVFQYLGLRTDDPDRFGQTPLHLAAMRGELSVVQYLVEELESDMSAKDLQGRTPYDLAVLKGYKRVSTYLARQEFRNRWNILAWWEASRAPYYFVLANIVGATLLYVSVIMPAMPDRKCICVPHLVWNCVTWVFFFFTKRTAPGDVSKDERYGKEYADEIDAMIGTGQGEDSTGDDGNSNSLDRPLCHSCHVQRPLRSKHCRVCKTCIHQFDHHCPFVDNCVGRDNYVYFMAFVGMLAVNVALLEYVLYLYWSLHGFRFLLLVGLVYFGVMLVPVAQLFGFHVYLTAKNLTTNEVMNSHRYQHMRTAQGKFQNPFDRGLVKNCAERCLPSYILDKRENGNDGESSRTLVKKRVTRSGEAAYAHVSETAVAMAV
ncbi:Palmitoyltransferase [Globisporangium polare]